MLPLTPLPLPIELVKLGISYVGACGAEVQRGYVNNDLHAAIVTEIQDPASPLHDSRLTPGAAASPGPSSNLGAVIPAPAVIPAVTPAATQGSGPTVTVVDDLDGEELAETETNPSGSGVTYKRYLA